MWSLSSDTASAAIYDDIMQGLTPRSHKFMPIVWDEDTPPLLLTGVELERLCGVPDGWSAPYGKDRQRLRVLGGMTGTPVLKWLMERILAIDDAVSVWGGGFGMEHEGAVVGNSLGLECGWLDTDDTVLKRKVEVGDADVDVALLGSISALEDGEHYDNVFGWVDTHRPRWVVFEDAARTVSEKTSGNERGGALRTLLRGFSERGYDVGWRVFNVRCFGCPQDSRRVFLVGHYAGEGRSWEVVFDETCCRRVYEPSLEGWEGVARTPRKEFFVNSRVKSESTLNDCKYTIQRQWGSPNHNVPSGSIYSFVACSGGKDSCATVLGLWERGIHVDEIIGVNEGQWWEGAVNALAKLHEITGIPVTMLTPDEAHSFEHLMYDYKPSTWTEGKPTGYGWPTMRVRWCTKECKVRVMDAYLASIKAHGVKLIGYIGIAVDEVKRVFNETSSIQDETRYPMVDWDMTEADALRYCYDHGVDFDGLYEHLTRLSCWCCPLQGIKGAKVLYSYYHDKWEELLDMDSRSKNSWLVRHSAKELDDKFKKEGLTIIS